MSLVYRKIIRFLARLVHSLDTAGVDLKPFSAGVNGALGGA